MRGLLILHHPEDRYFGEELKRQVADSAPGLPVRVLEAPLEDSDALAAFAAELPEHERSILMYGVGMEAYFRSGAAGAGPLAEPVRALLRNTKELSLANIGLLIPEAVELPVWWVPLAAVPILDTPMGAGPPDDAPPRAFGGSDDGPTGVFPPGAPSAPGTSESPFSFAGGDAKTKTGSASATPPLLYASYPNVLNPGSEEPLLVYVFPVAGFSAVQADRAKRLGDARVGDFGQAQNVPAESIPIGARLTAVPRVRDCVVDPGMLTVEWQGEWLCAPFTVKPGNDLISSAVERDLDADVTFYIGPVIVGEVRFSVRYTPQASATVAPAESHAAPYQKVFASYSHRDTALVEQLEATYTALGMTYLRDAVVLRSGESWNSRLLELIDEAQIFQLCWSTDASQSKYVEQEWRHALGLRRPYFVRPVYWTKPIPKPPAELSHLHFAYLAIA